MYYDTKIRPNNKVRKTEKYACSADDMGCPKTAPHAWQSLKHSIVLVLQVWYVIKTLAVQTDIMAVLNGRTTMPPGQIADPDCLI